MRICILAVGKLRDGPMKDLFAEYVGRLPWPLAVTEIADRGKDPTNVRIRREGEDLRGKLPAGRLVALDESGRNMTSEKFAAMLGSWQDENVAAVNFAIGGADGHCPETLQRADNSISFGKATWPHQLVRVMLAEQLYRASTILAGHPYHRSGKSN